MQPQNDAQAEFAMDFVFLARARRNQWSRYEASQANPQDEFNEPRRRPPVHTMDHADNLRPGLCD